MNTTYKIRSSVIIWSLHHNLHDAFVVWLLAHNYDRYKNRNRAPQGFINFDYFRHLLKKQMNCSKVTVRKRLKKAISFGFLTQEGRVISPKRMVRIALEQNEHNLVVTNDYLLKNDVEFTRELFGFVSPTDMKQTKSKLIGILAIQGNISNRGVYGLSQILNCSERQVIRSLQSTDLVVIKRFVLFDVLAMLVDRRCSRYEGIKAFIKAEKIYRHSKGMSSSLLYPKTCDSNTFLSARLSNSYFSTLDLQTRLAPRKQINCVQVSGHSDLEPTESGSDHSSKFGGDAKGVSAGSCFDSPIVIGFETTDLHAALAGSEAYGDTDKLLRGSLAYYSQYLEGITEATECHSLLEKETGAVRILPVQAAAPFVYRERHGA